MPLLRPWGIQLQNTDDSSKFGHGTQTELYSIAPVYTSKDPQPNPGRLEVWLPLDPAGGLSPLENWGWGEGIVGS